MLRRVVIPLTFLLVAGLAAVFAVSGWDQADKIASIVSALVAVAALGVGVWAALPGSAQGVHVRAVRTGTAMASGPGSRANTGVTGRVSASETVMIEGTGNARATDGGSANSGVDLHP